MSIAAAFREKWKAIAAAADATAGKSADVRYAAMAKAADNVGCALVDKAIADFRSGPHGKQCGCHDCT